MMAKPMHPIFNEILYNNFTHHFSVHEAEYCTFTSSYLFQRKPPPLDGGGLVQVRLRNLKPPPHVALHLPHAPNLLHPPLTATNEQHISNQRGSFSGFRHMNCYRVKPYVALYLLRASCILFESGPAKQL